MQQYTPTESIRIENVILLCFAVKSFIELVEFALSLPDVTVFLSNRLCQDPLETFFEQQRQWGRAASNTVDLPGFIQDFKFGVGYSWSAPSPTPTENLKNK